MDRSRLLGCLLLVAGCHAQAGFSSARTSGALNGPHCGAVRGRTEIDLMGADASVRSKVAASRNTGPMVLEIKGAGCASELAVLQCTVVGAEVARYAPFAASESRIAKDADELLSNQPVSTSSLMKEVSGQAAIRTDYELVGMQHVKGVDGTRPIELSGPECARATHVVSGVYLGGFTMVAGDQRELEKVPRIFGPGAMPAGRALRSEGDGNACAQALKEGREYRACSAPLRLSVISLEDRKAAAQAALVVATPPKKPVPPARPEVPVEPSTVDPEPSMYGNPIEPTGVAGTELARMTIRIIHTKARTEDASRAAARLAAHGATPQMYEVSDGGNDGYLGKIFLMTRFAGRFPLIASLLSDIEPLTPTIGDTYSYDDGQHANLWIAR